MENNENIKIKTHVIRDQEFMTDLDAAAVFEVSVDEIRKVVADFPSKFSDHYRITLTADEANTIGTGAPGVTGLQASGDGPVYAFSNLGIYMLGTLLHGDFPDFWSKRIIELYAKVQALSCTLSEIFDSPKDSEDKESLIHRSNELIAEIFRDTPLGACCSDVSILNIRKVQSQPPREIQAEA